MQHDPFGRSQLPVDLPGDRRPDARGHAAPAPSTADVLAELRALRADLAGLRAAFDASRHSHTLQRALGRGDRQTMATLLPAIVQCCGAASFAVRDLKSQAKLYPGLRDEIEHAFGADATNAKRLGKFFARIEGLTADGHRLLRVAAVREGALWKVERI